MTASGKRRRGASILAAAALVISMAAVSAQTPSEGFAQLSGRVVLPGAGKSANSTAAVVWLTSVDKSAPVQTPPPGQFTLVQKNRMFTPHLLVIPVGSLVSFPNEDPYFHNVFSLFNGKRFDLGLYEAGSSREVRFSREGVSYIFCNIHPEMSAVVIALSTPLYGVADSAERFSVHSIPPGQYELHVWLEGMQQSALDRLVHPISIRDGESEAITIDASKAYKPAPAHLNMFGKPYTRDPRPTY